LFDIRYSTFKTRSQPPFVTDTRTRYLASFPSHFIVASLQREDP
jgi:hypothetical protein